jgi:flagellar biosynthesis protein FlhF
MQLHTFAADSAADAIAQIREQLGPEAVILSVKKLPAPGLGRLWQRPRIELLACVPDKPAAPPNTLGEIKSELAELRQQMEHRSHPPEVPVLPLRNVFPTLEPPKPQPQSNPLSQTPSQAKPQAERPARTTPTSVPPTESGLHLILENMGLLPLHAQTVIEKMRLTRPGHQSVAQEIELACSTLRLLWRPSAPVASNIHIFIGPAGSGKTTCLSKWLAQSVLMENRPARVWRLDGSGPNTAESLSVYGEILGIPIERFASDPQTLNPAELLFVDLPGINWKDAESMSALNRQIRTLPEGHVHLVLNAAYETGTLLQQARSFSSLPITNIIMSHLDEEPKWGKLWNLVLGTNYSLGFLSAGQNIPGDFVPATASAILKRQTHSK